MKTKHFNIKEFVTPDLYKEYPEWKLWLMLDNRVLQIADAVREFVGEPCFINNWSVGY